MIIKKIKISGLSKKKAKVFVLIFLVVTYILMIAMVLNEYLHKKNEQKRLAEKKRIACEKCDYYIAAGAEATVCDCGERISFSYPGDSELEMRLVYYKKKTGVKISVNEYADFIDSFESGSDNAWRMREVAYFLSKNNDDELEIQYNEKISGFKTFILNSGINYGLDQEYLDFVKEYKKVHIIVNSLEHMRFDVRCIYRQGE